MPLKIAIAGGGTGGHVTPALAIAEEIARRGRGDCVQVIGSDRGIETRLVPAAGFELVALSSRQVMGRGALGRVRGVISILASGREASQALRRFGADALISVGGYAAMPAVLAARLQRIPIYVVEPNAVPGRVNRLSARFARRIFVAHETACERFPARVRARTEHTGVPLRRALIDAFVASPKGRGSRAACERTRLLVFGGSRGAHQINQTLIAALPDLADVPLEIFHQTGEDDRKSVAEAYAAAGVSAVVVAFEPDMPARYREADLAVCRAGALTVAELALAGLPAVLVPYPFAADDHQSANARELERAGAAVTLLSSRLDPARLALTVRELASDPERLLQMSRAAAALARPDAAETVVDRCFADLEAAP